MDIESIMRKINIDSLLDNPNPMMDHFNKIWAKLPIDDIIELHNQDRIKPEFLYFSIDSNDEVTGICFFCERSTSNTNPCQTIRHFATTVPMESLESALNIDIQDGHMLSELLLEIKLYEAMDA